MGALLPYWKTTKKDGREQRTYHQPSGLKFTGYLKIKKAGDYAFSLHVAMTMAGWWWVRKL